MVLQNFFESEENYVAALYVLLHYSKALTAALTSSQPVISKEEIACIFFHIPHLHSHHSEFLQHIKSIKLGDTNLMQVIIFIFNSWSFFFVLQLTAPLVTDRPFT